LDEGDQVPDFFVGVETARVVLTEGGHACEVDPVRDQPEELPF
jgi:hypothetical protein